MFVVITVYLVYCVGLISSQAQLLGQRALFWESRLFFDVKDAWHIDASKTIS